VLLREGWRESARTRKRSLPISRAGHRNSSKRGKLKKTGWHHVSAFDQKRGALLRRAQIVLLSIGRIKSAILGAGRSTAGSSLPGAVVQYHTQKRVDLAHVVDQALLDTPIDILISSEGRAL
jgi:hypothetical protein